MLSFEPQAENYERKFKSRTMAYLISGATFYLLIFRSLYLTGDLNIIDAAIAPAVRVFVMIFAVAAQVKLLQVIFSPLSSCALYLGVSSCIYQSLSVLGLLVAVGGLCITIYYYRDDISWMWLRGKDYLQQFYAVVGPSQRPEELTC